MPRLVGRIVDMPSVPKMGLVRVGAGVPGNPLAIAHVGIARSLEQTPGYRAFEDYDRKRTHAESTPSRHSYRPTTCLARAMWSALRLAQTIAR